MFSIDKSDYIITNLTKVISYECNRKGFQFEDDEIKYLIVLEVSNPAGNFTGANNKLDEELNRLADICVAFLCNSPSFVVKTLSVQAKFRKVYNNRETVLANYRDLIYNHTFPLVDDICRNEPSTDVDKENLYRKIILATVLLSGLGDPSKKSVYGNAEAALKSVFPIKNVDNFMLLEYKDKLKDLDELKRIVTGIRLYNHTRNKGKEDTIDLPRLIEDASEVVINKLIPTIESLTIICKALGQQLSESIHFDEIKKSLFIVETSSLFNETMLEDAKAYLLIGNQTKIYLRKLLKDAQQSQEEFYKLENTVDTALLSLNQDLKGKLAIPMSKVYDKFQLIGRSWSNLQEMSVVFNAINDAYINIMTTAQMEKLPKSLYPLISLNRNEMLCLDKLAMVFSKFLPNDSGKSQFSLNFSESLGECVIYRADEVSLDQLEFNGLGPVYAVESEGFLMEANVDVGVVKYKNKFYGFKNKSAALIFIKDPEKYITKVLEFARQHIQYIEVLSLRDEVLEERGMKVKFSNKVKQIKAVRNKEIQTEDHPIESYIDYQYSWNVWDYKRQAVKLASIEQCLTHSTQTYSSHFRAPAEVQTYSPREKIANTLQDDSTKMVKSMVYIWGLRGTYRDDVQGQVKLEVPSLGLDHCLPVNPVVCPKEEPVTNNTTCK